MGFFKDLIDNMNAVPLYEIEEDGKKYKTIRCDTVCDIITVLIDKYNIGADEDDLS